MWSRRALRTLALALGLPLLGPTPAVATVPPGYKGSVCVIGVASNDVLWIRSGPGASNRKVSYIRPQGCATATGRRVKNWVSVRDDGGRSGWVNERYVERFVPLTAYE